MDSAAIGSGPWQAQAAASCAAIEGGPQFRRDLLQISNLNY
jgi:hypothetical protein